MAHSEGKIAFELNGQTEVYKPLGVHEFTPVRYCKIFLEPAARSRVTVKLFRRKLEMKAKYFYRSPGRYYSELQDRAGSATTPPAASCPA